ncbi:MAG: C40 family peptidase [Deltaproteobacteria bacterium]|nr:C40 family peptidase [Deltaproteobacteria bacterium]
MKRAVQSLLAAGLLAGCATGLPAGARAGIASARLRPTLPAAQARALPPAGAASTPVMAVHATARREDVLARARALVGWAPEALAERGAASDCTGFVQAVFSPGGLDLLSDARPGDNAVTAMYRFAREHGRVFLGGHPLPGDLVFFRETYDRNRDGRANDGLTHVGLVEREEADGTVVVLHRVGRGVVRYRMNLEQRDARRDPRTGKLLNDVLRPPGAASAEVLTGQLFAAYGSVLPVEGVADRR